MDISGSFVKGAYFDDGIDFLAHYLYAHLNGLGGLEKPNVLFVGSIGGAKEDQPKTFYPIQTFQNMPVEAIAGKLADFFPDRFAQSVHGLQRLLRAGRPDREEQEPSHAARFPS